jgi:uncharacterized tellurite resistance protein B-like protein
MKNSKVNQGVSLNLEKAMNFWKNFKITPNSNKSTYQSSLHEKAHGLFPHISEEDLVKMTCYAGLMARVAVNDWSVEDAEIDFMKVSLQKLTHFNEEEALALTKMAIEDVQELAGIENHIYCHALSESLDNSQRYELLEVLFSLAASDEKVDNSEAEEIRLIAKGLRLEQKHYVAARATVLEYLQSLKK